MTTTSTAVQEPIPAYVPPQYPVIFMPIVFIPGVMGTRLGHRNANSNELERIWDPDSTGFMLSNYVMGSNRSKRQLLGTTNTPAAEPLRDDSDDLYTDFPDRIDRGFTEVAGSFYSRFLIELDNRFNLNRHRNSIARALGVTCPVHVFGYDWRIDANLMADNIKQRFNDLDTEYNIPDMPYVVITHSMGGLVSRKFLKDNSDIAQRVTGVIHGNQPAIGSTKFYGYFKVGADPIEPNSIDG